MPIRAGYFFRVSFNMLIFVLRKVVFLNSKYSQAIGHTLSGMGGRRRLQGQGDTVSKRISVVWG